MPVSKHAAAGSYICPGYRGRMVKTHFDCTLPFSKGKQMGLLFLGGMMGRKIIDINVDPTGKHFDAMVHPKLTSKSDEPLDRLMGILQDRTFSTCTIHQGPNIRVFRCSLRRPLSTNGRVEVDRMFRAYERLYPEHFVFNAHRPLRPASPIRRPSQWKRKAPSRASRPRSLARDAEPVESGSYTTRPDPTFYTFSAKPSPQTFLVPKVEEAPPAPEDPAPEEAPPLPEKSLLRRSTSIFIPPPPEALASEGEASDADSEEPHPSKMIRFEDSPRSPSPVPEEFDDCPEDVSSPEHEPETDTEEATVTNSCQLPKEATPPADLAKGIAQLHKLLLEDSDAVTSVLSIIRSEILPSMCTVHPCKMCNLLSFNQMLPSAGLLSAVLTGTHKQEEQNPLVLSLQTMSRPPRAFEFRVLAASSSIIAQLLAWRLHAEGDFIYVSPPAFFKDEDDVYHPVSVNTESVPLVMKNGKYLCLFFFHHCFHP